MSADVIGTDAGFAELTEDLEALGDGDLTARFRELEMAQRKVAAEMAAIAGEVDRRGIYRHDGHRAIPGWLRAQGNYGGAGLSRIRRVARLVSDHPSVGEDLYAGRIGVDQAFELGRAQANPRCGDQLGDVVDVLLDHAGHFSFVDFRTCVRRWEILADLDGAHRDRGRAVEGLRAAVVAGVDGVDISASGGTALQAAEMVAMLDAFADAEFERDRVEHQSRSVP